MKCSFFFTPFQQKIGRICLLGLSLGLFNSGCVGPATPFGAIKELDVRESQRIAKLIRSTSKAEIEQIIRPQISFQPKRQVLHDASKLKIVVDDPMQIADTSQVSVLYNGFDVSEIVGARVKRQLSKGGTRLTLELSNIRIRPQSNNHIDVYYSRRPGDPFTAHAALDAPYCRPFVAARVQSTEKFRVDPRLLQMIHRTAREFGYNPGLLTGLIAQESGFNTFSVSWAKALGITQVTSAAESSFITRFPQWPRYPGIAELTVAEIKTLIWLGRINGNTEWRLDEESSVVGGAAYLDWLRKYWYAPGNFALIASAFSDTELGLAQVILASYNSGPSRVRRALDFWGHNWLSDDELGEARNYVKRVFSYCYHFTDELEKAPDADAT